MKRLLIASAALAGTASPLLAQSEGPVTSWQDLDQDLAALEDAVEAGGPAISGWITTIWSVGRLPDTQENDGVTFDAVRLQMTGEAQGYEYKVSFDGFNGGMTMFDAYLRGPLSDDLTWTLGQFRTPFLRSGLMHENRYLFLSPTRSGLFYRGRAVANQGGLLTYSYDAAVFQLAMQNGIDGGDDESLITGRVTAALAGGGVPMIEGAYGAPDEFALQVAGAFSDDGALPDGEAVILEAAATKGRFFGAFEIADYGQSYTAQDLLTGVITNPLEARGDTTPWALTASAMVDPAREFEVALRYEDYDDLAERTVTTLGVNHYLQGHDVKLMLNWVSTNQDVGIDPDLFAFGASVSF